MCAIKLSITDRLTWLLFTEKVNSLKHIKKNTPTWLEIGSSLHRGETFVAPSPPTSLYWTSTSSPYIIHMACQWNNEVGFVPHPDPATLLFHLLAPPHVILEFMFSAQSAVSFLSAIVQNNACISKTPHLKLKMSAQFCPDKDIFTCEFAINGHSASDIGHREYSILWSGYKN